MKEALLLKRFLMTLSHCSLYCPALYFLYKKQNNVYDDVKIVIIAQGTKCELKVKNGAVYEGVFKTYGPEVQTNTSHVHSAVKYPQKSI